MSAALFFFHLFNPLAIAQLRALALPLLSIREIVCETEGERERTEEASGLVARLKVKHLFGKTGQC